MSRNWIIENKTKIKENCTHVSIYSHFHRLLFDLLLPLLLGAPSSWAAISSSISRSKLPSISGLGILFHRTLKEIPLIKLDCSSNNLLISNILWDSIGRKHNIQNVIDQLVLQYSIVGRRGRERGRCIDFDQPRFQGVINDDVVPVALEAVSITCHHTGNSFQRVYDQPGDRAKQFVGNLFATSSLQEESKVLNAPFATVMVVVFTLEMKVC